MPVNLWRRESRWRKGLRALGDAAAAVAALAGAFWVRIHLPLPFTAGLPVSYTHLTLPTNREV